MVNLNLLFMNRKIRRGPKDLIPAGLGIRLVACITLLGGWRVCISQGSTQSKYPNYPKPILVDSFSTEGFIYHYENHGEEISIFHPDSLPDKETKRPEDILSIGGSIFWHPQPLILISYSPFYNRRKLYNEFNIEQNGIKVINRYPKDDKSLRYLDKVHGLFFLFIVDIGKLRESLSHFYPLKRYHGLCYMITSVSELEKP